MIGYFVAITKRTSAAPRLESPLHWKTWDADSATHRFQVAGANTCSAHLETNGKLIASLGVLRKKNQPFEKDQNVVLGEILATYERTGELNVSEYDGCFVLFLVDPHKDHVFAYRNLAGGTAIYYTQTDQGFFFGNNLADVVRKSGISKRVNEEILPTYFICRQTIGKNTLFAQVYRILSGEVISWNSNQICHTRIDSLGDLLEGHKTNENESVDIVEKTMFDILTDWHSLSPLSAVFLSGGVDSTYMQVHWNKVFREFTPQPGAKSRSAAVVLDSEYTQGDAEYTRSAVQECGTDHLSVMQPLLSADFMREVLAATGEMPNHVQSFYFWTLGKKIREAGLNSGISGEGADGLFGSSTLDTILLAERLSKKLPLSFVRNALAIFGDVIKPGNYKSKTLYLSNHLNDLDWRKHPLNQAVTFNSPEILQKLFQQEQIELAYHEKRALIRSYGVARDPLSLQLTSAAGFVIETLNTSAYWGQMCMQHGVYLYHPFQDSRMIRVASNICLQDRFVLGNPKQVLKKALARHVSPEFINRPKRGFGQPIFEWLSPGGVLRSAAESIGDYPFMPKKVKLELLEKPNWILWSLLCFDLWYKEFIESFPKQGGHGID